MAPESRDEVRQRIESLYDQAENATGNFNATRAMASRTRSRGVPLAKRANRRSDPALDEIAQQWFDAARDRLGPTVPAVLPADRLPGRTPQRAALPARAGNRSGGGALPGGERAALEPGPAARAPQALEPGTGRAPAALPSAGAVAELPGGSAVAALPPGAATANPPSAGAVAASPGGGVVAASPGGGAVAALPDGTGVANWPGGTAVADWPGGTAVADWPGGTAVADRPGGSAGAEWLTAGSAAGGPPAVVPDGRRPVRPGAELPLPAMGGLDSTGGFAAVPVGLNVPDAMTDVLPAALPGLREQGAAAGFPLAAPAPATDTGAILYAAPSAPTTETGAFPAPPAPVTDTGGFAYTTPATPVTDTGSFAYTTPPAPITDTGSFTYATPPQPALDTGAFAYAAPSTPATDTGAAPYAAPQPALDTGAFAYTAPPAPITGASPYAAPPAPAPVTGTGAFAHPIAPGTSPAPDPTAFPAGVPVPESPRALRAAKAIAFARAQVGKPCVWGAMGPGSYDCSSLTQAAWKAAGVVLPRAAHEQALAGSPVTTAGIEPGDLVLFFDDDRHVGLHIGGGMMVHAPGPGAIIREESIYGAGEAAIHRIVRPA